MTIDLTLKDFTKRTNKNVPSVIVYEKKRKFFNSVTFTTMDGGQTFGCEIRPQYKQKESCWKIYTWSSKGIDDALSHANKYFKSNGIQP